MSVTIKKRRVRLTEIARDIGLDWPIITYAISSNSKPAVSKKKKKKESYETRYEDVLNVRSANYDGSNEKNRNCAW